MSDTLLRSRVIRLASSRPDLRPHLLPLLKEAGVKTAAHDTMDFVTWALKTQSRRSTDAVIQFLERHGTVKAESTESNRGKPIGKGEKVEIQANNAPGDLQDLLQPYHLQKGTVTDVEGEDIVIKVDGGDILRVPGGVNSGKKSGVYRTSVMEDQGHMGHVEIVYLPAGERKPSQVSIEVLRNYVEKGMAAGEERSENYFSGFVPNWKVSKDNNPYFLMFTQQRGGRPRTLSPEKGEVYYINLIGKRPSGWEGELAEVLASEAGGMGESV